MSTIIEHYGPAGRVFRFENPDDLYPVNRYQSLVLATSAYLEAATYAATHERPLRALRAIEFCCGGGAASIMLKAAGVGYVEATDVNPRALEACRHNATLNGISLDRVGHHDLLAPSRPSPEGFDLVVCNPPCGRSEQAETVANPQIRTVIDGGPGGITFIAPLFRAAQSYLVPEGRLIFIITSSMTFRSVQAELDRHFPGRWRLDDTTPVAQPYVHHDTPEGRSLLELASRREVFVWLGDDGFLWRISWVVVATHQVANDPEHDRRLWLVPRYYDRAEPGYSAALRAFNQDGPL